MEINTQHELLIECNSRLPKLAIYIYIYIKEKQLVAFKGREPVRSKTVTANKIIEKINSFNYLGNVIPYGKDEDSDNIRNNFENNTH